MIRNLALLGMTIVVAGCASQSPSVDPQAAAAATPAAPAAATRAAAATEPAATPVAASEAPPPGWKAKMRAGQTVYCRTVDVTGSMFPREVCLGPKELEAVLQAQKTQAQRTLDIPRTVDSQ